MKQLLIVILSLLSLPLMAQHGKFEATVVDALTHQPLPFASVYVSHDASTITNAEGTFAIKCDSTDVLRISYVGYKSTHIQASHLHNIVTLEPQETVLGEVLVIPIGPLIDKICKETLRASQKYKNKKGQFFYRQTAFSDSTCYEFAESFFSGGPAVSLHDLQLLSGRYAGLQPDSTHFYSFFGNFFTFSQLEVASNYSLPTKSQDVVPLFRNYDKFYDVSYEVTAAEEDGSRIFVIHFYPKPEALEKYSILATTLYVDEKTLHLRKIIGKGLNFRVVTMYVTYFNLMGVQIPRRIRMIQDAEFNYIINLTDERGFPEVQSAFVEAVYELNGKNITTRSLLYNLGDGSKKNKRSFFARIADFFTENYTTRKGEALKFGSVLHETIEMQGYNPEFWNKNEIVRRTPIEQDVLKLFEHQNLFGLMNNGNTNK